jgi:IPT/TIG domain
MEMDGRVLIAGSNVRRLVRAGLLTALAALLVGASLATATANPPGVDSLTPSRGTVDGGTVVEIAGKGFYEGSTVLFGGVPAASVEHVNNTHLIAVTPPHAAGKVLVNVDGSEGLHCKNGPKCKTDTFDFLGLKATETIPSHGGVNGGNVVTLVGDGFAVGSTGTTVKFGSAYSPSVECVSLTECLVVTPAGKKPGTVKVIVAVGKAKSGRTEAPTFTYELEE